MAKKTSAKARVSATEEEPKSTSKKEVKKDDDIQQAKTAIVDKAAAISVKVEETEEASITAAADTPSSETANEPPTDLLDLKERTFISTKYARDGTQHFQGTKSPFTEPMPGLDALREAADLPPDAPGLNYDINPIGNPKAFEVIYRQKQPNGSMLIIEALDLKNKTCIIIYKAEYDGFHMPPVINHLPFPSALLRNSLK